MFKYLNIFALFLLSSSAFAADSSSATSSTSSVDTIFSAVDLSSVVNFVSTTGVTIVGIALALKGISLAKRALNKA